MSAAHSSRSSGRLSGRGWVVYVRMVGSSTTPAGGSSSPRNSLYCDVDRTYCLRLARLAPHDWLAGPGPPGVHHGGQLRRQLGWLEDVGSDGEFRLTAEVFELVVRQQHRLGRARAEAEGTRAARAEPLQDGGQVGADVVYGRQTGHALESIGFRAGASGVIHKVRAPGTMGR